MSRNKSLLTSKKNAIRVLRKGMLAKSRMLSKSKSLALVKKQTATEGDLTDIIQNKARTSNQL